METWQGVVLTIITGVLAWLFIRQEKQGNMMTSIETKLNYIIASQKELDDKLNLFLKSEVDTLKELLRQGKPKPRNSG